MKAVINCLFVSSRSAPIPRTTPIVETTFSFATNPVIVATADCHCPNPNGLNKTAKYPPKTASIEFSDSASTILNEKSKFDKNQIIIDETKIIVPALFTKLIPLLNTSLKTEVTLGAW